MRSFKVYLAWLIERERSDDGRAGQQYDAVARNRCTIRLNVGLTTAKHALCAAL